MTRTVAYAVAASMAVVGRCVLWVAMRRGKALFRANSGEAHGWQPPLLFLASFLTLFAELAFIRWIAVEVRVFAYFNNLALLLCFLGFGLGCALVKRSLRWLPALNAFLGLLLIVRIPWLGERALEGLSEALGGAADVNIWVTPARTEWPSFLAATLLAGCLFVLMATIFIPLGQVVSRQMDSAPNPLRAYAWNLFGSLIGVAVFFLVSRWMLPPWIWMGAVLLGFAFLQNSREDSIVVASLMAPLVLLLYEPLHANQEVFWTPYQQIQYVRNCTPRGDPCWGFLVVNHTGYQVTVDLSSDFLSRHPELQREADWNPYNLPFRFSVPSPSVLVVGSGTGNDVAAAVRHHSRSVDAVEIDPAILDIGKREHPEHPYDSPLVAVHLGDARSFLKRTKARYNLIVFGLLDSHVQFSDYTNMRIDNFVYTEEAFREAAQHLEPNGIIFVKFQVDRPWLGTRIAEIMREALGVAPLIFKAHSDYSAGATCFVGSLGTRVNDALAADSALNGFVRKNSNSVGLDPQAVPITTDDWPFLYQRDRRIPRTYFSISVLVILIAIFLYSRVRRWNDRPTRFSLFFFAMGAGFMLLETQIISRLALFFGTIWQVNGIVISALLMALLVANAIVEKVPLLPKFWLLAGLLSALAFAYWFPLDRIATPTKAGIVAVVIFSIPVWFAGLLFSSEFRRTASPSAALNVNVLGAVTGGLLENLSLLYGLRSLLLVAVALYGIAGLAVWRNGKQEVLLR